MWEGRGGGRGTELYIGVIDEGGGEGVQVRQVEQVA